MVVGTAGFTAMQMAAEAGIDVHSAHDTLRHIA